jgi:hypothetical protein
MPGVTLERGSETVRVRIPMKMKRRGGRKVILVPDGLQDPRPMQSQTNIPLAAAVARGHEWQEMFLSGRYGTISELAERIRVDKSFVTRLMRLALLAPDIVDTIMDGREPDGLTFKDLTVKAVPASWEEQRRRWRFDDQ